MAEGVLKAAAAPRSEPLAERLLTLEPPNGAFRDGRICELPVLLAPRDLLVVNDAATLPASLRGFTGSGEPIEVRLAGTDGSPEGEWTAVLFGRGDWRTRTEDRPLPPLVRPGDRLRFGRDLAAVVRGVSPESPRLVILRFEPTDDAFWRALYRHGRPVQYSHLERALPLWSVQTAYGARPWAVEPPSAGLPLEWELLESAKRGGVALAWITHAAGLSSTGDADLDALLPLPERFDVPRATVEAVEEARRSGGRVIAAGTSVVRALEGSAAARSGRLAPGSGVTDVRVGSGFPLRVVDGLLTGLHEPGTSHFDLLTAFAPADVIRAALRHAQAAGYLGHEFGDAMLILPSTR